MANAEELVREFEQLRGKRGTWESHWQEIAERIMPSHSVFYQNNLTKGEKRTQYIYDSTAALAVRNFKSVLASLLTPADEQWHKIKTSNSQINNDTEVKEFFETLTDLLFRERYSSKSNFVGQKSRDYHQASVFGTSSLFIDEGDRGNIRYHTTFLGDTYFVENHEGIIDTCFRRFMMRSHAAQTSPRFANKLPDRIKKAQDPFQEHEFIHVVKPNDQRDPQRADFQGMDYASYYIAIEGKQMLDISGYTSFPYAVSRFDLAPYEIYGRSPSTILLPDIKMLNEMSKTDIAAVHKLVDPPLLLNDDGLLGGGGMNVSLAPGALNFGGVNGQGQQLIQPLVTGARVDIAEEKMERRRQTINEGFFLNLFQVLVDNPRMTATEALIKAQEKGQMIGPFLGQFQSESFGVMIEREINILQRQGKLPPLPGLLIEAEGEYEFEYDSPLNRLQKTGAITGIQQTLEVAAPFAQIDPSIMQVFNGPEVVRLAAEVNGVPNKVLRTQEEVEDLQSAQQEQDSQAAAIEQMQPAATALKDVAQAQSMLREPVQ